MTRRLLLLPAVAAALGVLLTGCGGSSKGSSKTPPPIQPPQSNQPTNPMGDPKPLPAPARKALQAFLRGVAADDTGVCKYVSPAYDKDKNGAFGQAGGCKKATKATFKKLKAKQITELKGVEVAKGMAGPQKSQYTVHFADLKWTKGTLAQGILADQYVLGKIKGKWLIVG